MARLAAAIVLLLPGPLFAGAIAAQERLFAQLDADPQTTADALRIPEAAGTLEWMTKALAKRRSRFARKPIDAAAVRGVEDEIAALRVREGPSYEAFVIAALKFAIVMDNEPHHQDGVLAFRLRDYAYHADVIEMIRRPREYGLIFPAPQALLEDKAVFVETAGRPIHFGGLVTERAPGDGVSWSPLDFFLHDVRTHGLQRAKNRIAAIEASGLPRRRIEGMIKDVHEAVRREIARINDDELRRQAIDLWFEFSQDDGRVLPAAADFAERVAGPGRYDGGYPIDKKVAGRLQRAQERAVRRVGLVPLSLIP